MTAQNHQGILNDMANNSKWNKVLHAPIHVPRTECAVMRSRQPRGCIFERSPSKSNGDIAPSGTIREFDSERLLFSSLRDHGFDDVDIRDIHECPRRVVSIVWKLLSDRYSDLRVVDDERGNMARIVHDNKVLTAKVSKLVEANDRLRNQIKDLESVHLKREAELRARLENLEQNRTEWERCAIAYKSRESKFVAEIRKQESQYVQLQTRMSRSVDPTRSLRRHNHRLEFN